MVVLLAARFPPTVFQAVTRWVEDHQICRLLEALSAFFFWAALALRLAAAGLGLAVCRRGFVVSMADTTLIVLRPHVGVFDLARAGRPRFLAVLGFVVAARLTEAFFFGGLFAFDGGRPHRGFSVFRSSDLALVRGFDLT